MPRYVRTRVALARERIEGCAVEYLNLTCDLSVVTGPLLPYVLVDDVGRVWHRQHGLSDWVPLNYRFEHRAVIEARELMSEVDGSVLVWSRWTKGVVA